MTTLEELRQAIENGHPRDAQFLVSRALEEHIHPSVIVEQAMVPAMKTVGNITSRTMRIFQEYWLLPAA
ncbi:MAG: B12-binding domain-containing protein [Blautia marasmi]